MNKVGAKLAAACEPDVSCHAAAAWIELNWDSLVELGIMLFFIVLKVK